MWVQKTKKEVYLKIISTGFVCKLLFVNIFFCTKCPISALRAWVLCMYAWGKIKFQDFFKNMASATKNWEKVKNLKYGLHENFRVKCKNPQEKGIGRG